VKFILLKSRGGDYLVVAANIAYLRADENGQTKVGMVGGDSLLVVGSMEEVAEKGVGGLTIPRHGEGFSLSSRLPVERQRRLAEGEAVEVTRDGALQSL